MWVNRQFFDMLTENNLRQQEFIADLKIDRAEAQGHIVELKAQKAKDDVTIDWMRHRINALEKEKALLFAKAAGIHVPIPEIVPTRPGAMSEPPDFSTMPSFEDVGDTEAARLGLSHDDSGNLVFDVPKK